MHACMHAYMHRRRERGLLPAYVASTKHEGSWENLKELCKLQDAVKCLHNRPNVSKSS